MTDTTNSGDTKECPFCAETIKAQANYCKHCKTDLDADALNVEHSYSVNEPIVRPAIRSDRLGLAIKKQQDNSSLPFIIATCTVLAALGGGAYVLTQKKEVQPSNQANQVTDGGAPNATTVPEAALESDKAKSPLPAHEIITEILQADGISDTEASSAAWSRLTALPKPARGDNAEGNRLNKIGLKLLNQKNFRAAAANFKLAHIADPAEPKFLSNIGFALFKAGDFNQAENFLEESIATAPERSVAWGDLGLVLAKNGEPDNAVASFLIGYKVSNGKTLTFLKSLTEDEDSDIRALGKTALAIATKRPGHTIITKITEIGTRIEGDTDGSSGDSVGFANGCCTYAYSKLPGLVGARVGDPVELLLLRVPESDSTPAEYQATDLRTHKSWRGLGPVPSQSAPSSITQASHAGSFSPMQRMPSALPKAGLSSEYEDSPSH